MPKTPILLWRLLLPVAALRLISAALVNVTVDDTGPDPHSGAQFNYTPAETWNTAACVRGGCTFRADTRLAGGGTWHESTFFPTGYVGSDYDNVTTSASISFNGEHLHCTLCNAWYARLKDTGWFQALLSISFAFSQRYTTLPRDAPPCIFSSTINNRESSSTNPLDTPFTSITFPSFPSLL
jgi:hypothetical protein